MNKVIIACALVFAQSTLSMEQQVLTPAFLQLKHQPEFISNNRLQLTVANQFEKGSATDCGYHALINGLTIAQLIRQTDPAKRQKLVKTLVDYARKKHKYFDSPDSIWKKRVIELRAHPKIKEQIIYQLLSCLARVNISAEKPEEKALHWQYLCKNTTFEIVCPNQEEHDRLHKVANVIVETAQLLTIDIDRQENLLKPGSLLPQAIAKAITKALDSKIQANQDKPTLQSDYLEYKNLKENIGIARYFNLKEIQLESASASEKGTWLLSSHIQALFDHISTKDLTKELLQGVTLHIIENNNASGASMESDLIVTGKAFQDFKADYESPDKDVLSVIVLFTPLSDSSENGHWFSFVVNKIGNTVQWILADSGGNTNRIYDDRVNALIKFLGDKDCPLEMQAYNDKHRASFISSIDTIAFLKAIVCIAIVIVIIYMLHKKQKDSTKGKDEDKKTTDTTSSPQAQAATITPNI